MSIMEQNNAWPSRPSAAKNAHEFAHKARQKEGGLWNFLTWAFFISQALGGDQFIGAAAAATAEGDPQGRKSDGSDDVAKNSVSGSRPAARAAMRAKRRGGPPGKDTPRIQTLRRTARRPVEVCRLARAGQG